MSLYTYTYLAVLAKVQMDTPHTNKIVTSEIQVNKNDFCFKNKKEKKEGRKSTCELIYFLKLCKDNLSNILVIKNN